MLRGGSWYGFHHYVRFAFRSGVTTEFRANYIGFRVGRALSQ
jgi:hypothetical protein